jgi:hypothetical protein
MQTKGPHGKENRRMMNPVCCGETTGPKCSAHLGHLVLEGRGEVEGELLLPHLALVADFGWRDLRGLDFLRKGLEVVAGPAVRSTESLLLGSSG